MPSDYDGDGNARSEEFTGLSFNSFVGQVMTSEEYNKLPEDVRAGITCLGATLDGRSVYGSVISSEGGFDEGRQNPTERTERVMQSKVNDALETIALMRQGLADEGLNPRPRNRREIPEGLL